MPVVVANSLAFVFVLALYIWDKTDPLEIQSGISFFSEEECLCYIFAGSYNEYIKKGKLSIGLLFLCKIYRFMNSICFVKETVSLLIT